MTFLFWNARLDSSFYESLGFGKCLEGRADQIHGPKGVNSHDDMCWIWIPTTKSVVGMTNIELHMFKTPPVDEVKRS